MDKTFKPYQLIGLRDSIPFEKLKSMADRGDVDAQAEVAACYYLGVVIGKNGQKMLEYARKAASKDNPEALSLLGVAYEEGLGTKKNLAKSAEWYQKAVKLKYPVAMCNLGYMYEKGTGVPVNPTKALQLYQEALQLGWSDACFDLYTYYTEQGTEPNAEKALGYLTKGARCGSSICQAQLGLCYLTGGNGNNVVVPKDYGKAFRLFTLSALKNVVDVFVKGVKALGLTEGVAKGDVKYTEKGAMIGEIAGRLSGGYMSGWTYPYASGVNLTMEAMKIALGLGKTLPSEIECNAVSHERAFISIPGVVSVIYGEDKAVASPFVKNVFFRVKEGSRVDFPRNNVEKCGNVISRCADRRLSLKGAEMAVSEIVLRLEKNNESTQNYLMGVENKYEKGFPYSAYELSSDELIAFEKEVESLDSVIIGENESIVIPESLASFAGERQDFNYRTILNTLDKVKKYAGARKSVPAIKFWKSLIRGGVQGALYAVDTWGTEC